MAGVISHWPIELREGDLSLRRLRYRESRQWHQLRARNADWLRQWDATLPAPDPDVPRSYAAMVRRFDTEARSGRGIPLALQWQGRLVGQVSMGGIAWGSLRSAYIGYWIDRDVAGRGLMPLAVALTMDYAFGVLDLHRVEIVIRPENRASLRVVEKLGLREEGLRPRYLHIDGDWRDHRVFAITSEECPGGLRARLRASQDHR